MPPANATQNRKRRATAKGAELLNLVAEARAKKVRRPIESSQEPASQVSIETQAREALALLSDDDELTTSPLYTSDYTPASSRTSLPPASSPTSPPPTPVGSIGSPAFDLLGIEDTDVDSDEEEEQRLLALPKVKFRCRWRSYLQKSSTATPRPLSGWSNSQLDTEKLTPAKIAHWRVAVIN